MGISKPEAIEASSNDSLLGDWHANLIYIERKKCVVLVNDKTLINFIIPEVTKKILNDFQPIFCHYLEGALFNCDIAENIVKAIISDYKVIKYAKSNSKRHLGFLNELAYNYEYIILENGGIKNVMMPEIVLNQNKAPLDLKDIKYPIEELKKLVT